MSSHCNRYPECGCPPDVGMKCHLPEGHGQLSVPYKPLTEAYLRNPEDPNAIYEEFQALKNAAFESENARSEYDERGRTRRGQARGLKPSHKKHGTNYTPPKRRHR